jgi:hypothetical protein
MSDTNSTGFGKFVPGFDFLQNLAKGAGAGIPQMPNLGAWVAPSLSVEDLDKRIEELKNVQFWLEQNSRALSATIQALEVQKLTLATLKGMNFNIAEMANAFKPKPAAPAPQPEPEPEPEDTSGPEGQEDDSAAAPASEKADTDKGPDKDAQAKPMIDPLQLWGSLTQQFQTIAASALKEATAAAAKASAKAPSKAASKASTKSTAKAPPKAPAKKAAAKKPAAKRSPAKRAAPAKAAARKPAGR